MTQPVRLYKWATTTNYPAGSDRWSGTIRRTFLSDAELAAGFTPGQRAPAQWFNGILGNFGDHLDSVIDIAAYNWGNWASTEDSALNTMNSTIRVVSGRALVSGYSVPHLFILGNSVSTVLRSPDGRRWAASSNPIPGATATKLGVAAHPIDARIVCGDGTTLVMSQSTDGGDNWTTAGTIPSGGPYSLIAVTPHSSGPTWIAMGNSDIATSTTLSGNWTIRTTPAPFVGVAKFKLITSPVGGLESQILAMPVASGTQVMISGDAGVTWSAQTVDATSRVFVDCFYSVTRALWMLLCQDGTIFTRASLSGGSWLLAGQVSGADAHCFSEVGRAVVVARNPSAHPRAGNTAVSTDLVNWRYFNVWDQVAAQAPRILKHDGRLVLVRGRPTGGGAYWQDCVFSQRLPGDLNLVP